MRKILNVKLSSSRVTEGPFASSEIDGLAGVFIFTSDDFRLKVISSGPANDVNKGWEHVSVSMMHVELGEMLPEWNTMKFVKELFWDDEETVLQFHPKKSEYVNVHDGVLHLWKPPYEVALPPKEFV